MIVHFEKQNEYWQQKFSIVQVNFIPHLTSRPSSRSRLDCSWNNHWLWWQWCGGPDIWQLSYVTSSTTSLSRWFWVAELPHCLHLRGESLNWNCSQHGDNDVDNVDNNVDNVDNNVDNNADNMVTMTDIYNAAPHALLVPAKVKNFSQLSLNFLNCLELSSISLNFSQLSKFL